MTSGKTIDKTMTPPDPPGGGTQTRNAGSLRHSQRKVGYCPFRVCTSGEPPEGRDCMSLFRCSACGERVPGKLAQVTWAWWNAANDRVAWRQRLCIACFAMGVAPLHTDATSDVLACPMCHTNSEDDMDPVYCTSFVPSVGRVRLELPTCAPCAVELRNRAMSGAVRLEDREPESGGRGPQTDTPPSAWEAFGILPRE